MKPAAYVFLCLLLVLAVSGCSTLKLRSKTESNTQTKPQATPHTTPHIESTPSAVVQGDLQIGQASGSYTANGQTVELRYAYAGRAVRFANESIVILLTEKPIPAESVAGEIQTPTMLESEQLKGLEYAIDKEAMWVRFHPGQYQESSSIKLKEYTVEGDIVRGFDDGSGHLNEKYDRKVKFVAAIVK
jgi:hypothetical protein